MVEGFCVECGVNCKKCEYINQCLECSVGILHQGACLQSCPSGYFEFEFSCVACMNVCKTCVEADHCQSCAAGFFLQNYQGKTICTSNCSSGQVVLWGECRDVCPSNADCLTCSSLCFQFCGEDSPASQVEEDFCRCSEATLVKNTKCYSVVTLTTDSLLQLNLDFAAVPLPEPSKDDFMLELGSNALNNDDWTFNVTSPHTVSLILKEHLKVAKLASVLVSSTIKDEANRNFYPSVLNAQINAFSITPTDDQTASKETAQVISSAISAMSLIGSVMCGDSQLFASMFLTVQLITYLPLADFNLSPKLKGLLIGSNQLNSLRDLPLPLKCTKPNKLAQEYGFECSEIYLNAPKELLCLTIVLTSFVLLTLIFKSKRRKAIINTLARHFVAIVSAAAISLSVKSGMQYESHSSAFGLVLSLIAQLLYIAAGAANTYFTLRNDERINQAFGFVCPTGKAQMYFSVFVVHSMSYGLVLTLLDSQVVQMSLLLLNIGAVFAT